MSSRARANKSLMAVLSHICVFEGFGLCKPLHVRQPIVGFSP
jgi:hypothetical protein